MLVVLLAAVTHAGEATSAFEPTAEYEHREIAGFKVLISRKAQVQQAVLKEALELLEKKLGEINTVLPKERLAGVKKCTLWLEWDMGEKSAARAHHSADWLTKNGLNPEKAGSVEISHLKNFIAWTHINQPCMVLHELAHYFHHWVLEGGEKNADIKAAFDNAVKSGKYDSVEYFAGARPGTTAPPNVKKRAYALNNASEYFAELTEAYFGRNDFYPFTKDELAKHDPEGLKLMEKVWGKVERAK